MFLGYPYDKKGYKVLNLETKHVFFCRDVKFEETIFSFKDIASTSSLKLFPSPSTYYEDDPLSSFSTPFNVSGPPSQFAHESTPSHIPTQSSTIPLCTVLSSTQLQTRP